MNKEKKAEAESMQALLATAKRGKGDAERRAEQLAGELAALKQKGAELVQALEVAEKASALVLDIEKRVRKAPAGLVEGGTLPEQVRFARCRAPDVMRNASRGRAAHVQRYDALCATQVACLIAKAKQAAKLQTQIEQTATRSQADGEARAAADARAQARLQDELSSAIADTSAAQDALQLAQAELARVQEQVRACALALYVRPHCALAAAWQGTRSAVKGARAPVAPASSQSI